MYKIIIASILVLLMTSCTGLEIGSGMLMGSQILSMVDNSYTARKQLAEKQEENRLRGITASNIVRMAESLENLEAVRQAKEFSAKNPIVKGSGN